MACGTTTAKTMVETAMKDMAVQLMSLADSQVTELRSESKMVAELFIKAYMNNDGNHLELMAEFYNSAAQPYRAAKAQKNKNKATRLGRAWNNLRAAIGYHLGKEQLVATWPRWTDTAEKDSLAFALKSKAEVNAERKERKAAEKESEAMALEAETRAAQARELDRIRNLTEEQLVGELEAVISAAAVAPEAIVKGLAKKFGLRVSKATAKPAKATAKPAKVDGKTI